MATLAFYRMGLVCSIVAFVLMFVAFASPFWYKSWTRVHSPFGSIGLWHVCLSGFIMPRDPVMKSYVGCWWIHSTEFELVSDQIMPAWFRIIQTLCVVTVLLDLVAVILILLYLLDGLRQRVYNRTGRMFMIDAILMLVSAFLVFLISLIFAEMSNDSSWMPRPWMNYLSWSYGLCVLSGFFAAFGGMVLFILALIYMDKDKRELDNLDSAAEMRRREERMKEKEEEATAPPVTAGPTHISSTRFSPPDEMTYRRPPPVAAKPAARVGESFV
ncbi:uncharacterized protein LOC143276792 [Babylonia areolata]|uniref:uncharacterized protein LOC143276792 n=1 Tax=Babylonia areolata TaxID=304850 RepID=UPI003FD5C1AC